MLAALLLAGIIAPLASAAPVGNVAAKASPKMVTQATVTVLDTGCAGAVAGDRQHVVTAAHCVPDDATEVRVKLGNGKRLRGEVIHLDRAGDLAVLALDAKAPVTPLAVAARMPRRGEQLLFVGRMDRRGKTQLATVDRLAPCPSLPDLDRAAFTSVVARPGDSGAPLVDDHNRIVALIHGGARCHIAVPAAPLSKLSVFGGSRALTPPAPQPAPLREKHFGPLVVEKTTDGLKFHFEFKWNFKFGG
jgi:S1-C subfamily serine protease